MAISINSRNQTQITVVVVVVCISNGQFKFNFCHATPKLRRMFAIMSYIIYNISYIRFIIPRDHSIPSISQVELPVSVSAIGHHRTTHSPSVLACARIKQNGHRQNFHPTQALCLNTQNKRSLFKLCRVWCGHYTISRHNTLAESRENRGRMATESAYKESPIFIMFTAHFKNDRKRINK